MDHSANLTLPYIAPAQAQKHVTHNEAIRALDALVQLSVQDRDLTTAPAAPADGARYIVGPAATGAWAGQAGKIAAFQDGAWAFMTPREGWLAWVADEDKLVVYDGAGWILAANATGGVQAHAALTGLGNDDHPHYLTAARGDGRYLPLAPVTLGINATGDATNRLAVSAPASLFNHQGAGHQLKLNKADAASTASLLYQTAFSGRAEMGLAGDDDFRVKVSADGAAWHDAIVVNRTTGAVTMPNTASGGGGTGTPGGSAGQLQFNAAGAFAGDAGLTYDDTTDTLTLGGALKLPTTSSAGAGSVQLNGQRFLHGFGAINNAFVGVNAGNFSMTGVGNCAVGYVALSAVTTGSYNMAFGQAALGSLTTGAGNVAIGNSSLGQQAAGSGNVGVGSGTLAFNTGGSGNVAIGDSAAGTAGAATGLIAIGQQAGNAATAPAYSILIGRLAGYQITTGGGNVCIGHQTGAGLTTGANNTIVGSMVTGLPAAMSNNVVIADGNGNRRFNADAAGNIGLNTPDQYGGGAGVVGIKNCTAVPSANPAGGGVLFVEAGALKFRGAGGTVTTIAPA